jgi:hypothetical protein
VKGRRPVSISWKTQPKGPIRNNLITE